MRFGSGFGVTVLRPSRGVAGEVVQPRTGVLVWVGDKSSSGFILPELELDWAIDDRTIANDTINRINFSAATDGATLLTDHADKDVILWCPGTAGFVDMYNSTSSGDSSVWITRIQQAHDTIHGLSDKFATIATTIPVSAGPNELTIRAFNNEVRNNWSSFADFFIDMAAFTESRVPANFGADHRTLLSSWGALVSDYIQTPIAEFIAEHPVTPWVWGAELNKEAYPDGIELGVFQTYLLEMGQVGSSFSTNIPGLGVSGTVLQGVASQSGSFSITETLAGAFNSPISRTIIVGNVAEEPSWSQNPSISGTPESGQTLTGHDGTYENGTVSARAWLSDGTPISDATGTTYALTDADIGFDISYLVELTGDGGTASAESDPVGPVTAIPVAPSWSVNPSITGDTVVGQTLTGADGTYANGTVSSRSWLRDGVSISGATTTTYVLVEDDASAEISYLVELTGAGGTVDSESTPVGPVTEPEEAATGTLTLTAVPSYDELRVYQRTTKTGGSTGKGAGVITLPITGATSGTIFARVLSDDLTTVLENLSPITITNGQTAIAVPVAARKGWFHIELQDHTGTWQRQTYKCGMGRMVMLAGQSLIVRFISRQEQTPTFASLGITPEPNASIVASYGGGAPSYLPTTIATIPWERASDAGNFTSTGVNEFLKHQVDAFGVNCGAVSHSFGGVSITTFIGTGARWIALQPLIARAGGAFEACVWGQGHGDSLYGLPAEPYRDTLNLLFAQFTAANNMSYTKYLFSIPLIRNIAWGEPKQYLRLRQGAALWASENDATYVAMDDYATLDGVHENQLGAQGMAQHLHRATRAELGLSDDHGPELLSATRVGTTLTAVFSDVGQTNLVLSGDPTKVIHVFPTGKTSSAVSDTVNRFPAASVTVVNKTTLSIVLANDPGDGHVLDLYPYFTNRDQNDGSVNNIRDDRVDGDGIAYGRQIKHATAVSSIVVAAPTPGGTINAPPGGFVARVSPWDATGTMTYQASPFGQEAITGIGSSANNRFPYFSGGTVEAFFTCPALGPAVKVVGGAGDTWIGITTGGRLTSTGSSQGATVLVPGKRYHAAITRGPGGTQWYLTNLTDGGPSIRDYNLTTPITTPPRGAPMGLRALTATSFPMVDGALDEIAVFYGARYSGATYIAPTAPFSKTDPNIVALYHLNGDLVEVVDAG